MLQHGENTKHSQTVFRQFVRKDEIIKMLKRCRDTTSTSDQNSLYADDTPVYFGIIKKERICIPVAAY